jgi:ubiquinone/menaquinone biosynthesis C-methylase UbiE
LTADEEARVAAGYDSVYDRLPQSETFRRIWREHASGIDFPEGFDHISFVTSAEIQRIADMLREGPHAMLVDLACGTGGPGLWLARELGAKLTGVDISDVALDHARDRARQLGLASIAEFSSGSFAATGLPPASADAAVSFDALQYAPDKRAALDEIARVLRPGGRLVFTCFEFAPERVAGLPVLGTDPVDDYAPLLANAGFDVTTYEETPGWNKRLTNAYSAVADARAALIAELAEAGTNALLGEITLTLQLKPYRRRVFASAVRT